MLFDRVASLVIGKSGGKGRELRGLRVAFEIQKGATDTPNKSTVRVWNMAPETRKTVEAVGAAVILKAGYAEDAGLVTLFIGTVTRATTTREDADWITEIELADGFLEYRDTKASVSFSPGATTLQVVSDLAGRFGLPVRALPSDVAAKQYPNGFAFAGRLRDAMGKACGFMGLEWSIQNGEIQVIKKGGVYRKRAYVLSPETGLIGSPEAETKTMTDEGAAKKSAKEKLHVAGFKAVSLLQPLMEPGGFVQLKTRDVKGEFFRVEEVTHSGDTHGDNWFSELALRYAK